MGLRSDRHPRSSFGPRLGAVVRRWAERPPPVAVPSPDRRDDLVADIVAMTGQAAVDGLPLSAVLDDLRLVLELEPTDPLPVFALRACVLEWARATQGLGRTLASAPVSLDDLEGLIWAALGSSPERLPAQAVVVRISTGAQDDDATAPDGSGRLLDDADVLAAAARVMEVVFDRPGEHVVLLRTPPAAATDRVVALLPVAVAADGAGEEDRVTLLEANLASAPLTGGTRWSVEHHLFDGHPHGQLAGLREALGPA